MADNDQREDFLTEIEPMKNMGSHKNIVNKLGCSTVQEPMFLLVEYILYDNLLHYLRKRRTKVESYLLNVLNLLDQPFLELSRTF